MIKHYFTTSLLSRVLFVPLNLSCGPKWKLDTCKLPPLGNNWGPLKSSQNTLELSSKDMFVPLVIM